MEIMKPFDVTDITLTSSSIAEPDIASGEVEWKDPNVLTTFGSYTSDYYASVTAGDGFIYCVGSSGDVLKIDPITNSILPFTSYSGTQLTATLAGDGNVYCVGLNNSVLKINVAGQSLSTFGVVTGTQQTATLAGDGNIYCVGNAGSVLKIDVTGQSTSTFGVLGADTYEGSALAGDGNIYCVGRSGNVLKIDIATQTVSKLSGNLGSYFSAVTAGDGNIYCAGIAGKVLKISYASQQITTIGSTNTASAGGILAGDGNIYFSANGGKVLKVDVADQSIESFGVNSDFYAAMSIGGSGDIYSVGSSGEVMIVSKPYDVESEVVKTSTHRVYKAAVVTRDDPEIGVTLVPPSWVDLQYTNKYRMFNDAKDSKSTATSNIVTEFDFNKSVTTVATLGVIGTSVMVTVTDPVDGVVYEVEKETADAGVNDFWAWFFEPYTFREDLVFDGIPPGYQDTTVKVEVKATSGERAVGRVLSGLPVNIGVTNEPTTVGRQNFTLRTRDGFGNLTITPKRSIKVLNYDVAVSKNDLDSTDRVLESVGKIPALYIGEGDLESMICFGMAEDYRMDHNSAFSNMRLEVKEI